jgi:hypothetical protein
MSCIGENKNKFPVELISKLLTRLLDSRLNQLEKKAEEEMVKIKSASKNTNVMINELQCMNKNVKTNLSNKKSIISNSVNLFKRNNFIHKTSTSKLNTSFLSKRANKAITPDRVCYTKIKDTHNNCLKNFKFHKKELFFDDFLGNKSNNTSRILNSKIKRDNKGLGKTPIRKNVKHLTKSTTMCSLRGKNIKEKPKQNDINNTNLNLVKNNHSFNLYKSLNKSCKILPKIKKEKLNKSFLSKSILSKEEQLDKICYQTHYNDKRIFGLNPDVDKSLLGKSRKGTISSVIFKKKTDDLNISKIEDSNDILKFDDNLTDEINNDELLIYYHNKETVKLIDDITLDKSFLCEDIKEKDLNLEIKIDNHKNNDKKINNLIKNNYTFDEKIEIMIEHLTKYLNKEDLLKIGLINKSCFKIIMYHLILKKEYYIDEIKESLSSLKKNNPEIIEKIDKNKFNLKLEFDNHTNRAISLLNSKSKVSYLNEKSIDINNKYIILVFDLFFIALGFKKKILSFKNNSKLKWNFYKNYLLNDNNESIGQVISNLAKGIVLDDEIINSLYEYSHNYLNVITPNFFKKTNNDIALFVFIVKNILEQVGITKDVNNKKNVIKLFKLYNVRINYNSSILQKLNKINDIISAKK